MRSRPLPVILAALPLLPVALAGCGDKTDDKTDRTPVAAPSASASIDLADRAGLSGRAAAALDRSYAALYQLTDGEREREVVATIGGDGTWRVDVGRAMRGGTTDVSIVSTAAGVFQCTVSTAANPITPNCVKVAAPGKKVPGRNDPKIERLFRPALAVFTDREASIAVAEVEPLKGATGACYSVDSILASLDPPVDIGIYCYTDDGVLTAARTGLGVLTMVNQVAGPATVALPGPEVKAEPMTTATPPPPAPAPEPSSSVPPA